ncbi:MAG: transposase [Oligoflexales bacterium]
MQIIGYLYGINSDRRLCEEVRLNIAYRWFARIPIYSKVPDHSSMTQ